MARIFLVVLIFFVCLVLFIRSPWGQEIIVDKVVNYVSDKTNTKVEIDRLFITFSGNIFLEGLYLEDLQGDTLIYSKALEANLPISPILFKNEINLKSLEWDGLRANIERGKNTEKFNFNFLLEAFAPSDSTTTSQSKPMSFDVGTLDFSNFNIKYNDQFLGLQSKLKLGGLYLSMDSFNLENMRFKATEFQLEDSQISHTQYKVLPVPEDTTEVALPYFELEDLRISKVKAQYSSAPDGIETSIKIGDFQLEDPKIDLAKNDFKVDELALIDSNVFLKITESKNSVSDSLQKPNSASFIWPDFKIGANEITMENNIFDYRLGNSQRKTGEFNPNAILVSDLDLQASDLVYRPKKAELQLNALSFREKSGFRTRNLSFKASVDNKASYLRNLNLQTNNSSITGKLSLNYISVDDFLENPQTTKVALSFPNISLALQDAYYFQPDLANNMYIEKASEDKITGHLKADGTLADIEMPLLNLEWGNTTSLVASGQLKNVTKPDSLLFDLDTIQIVSTKKDIAKFISENQLGISLPETVNINANIRGSLENILADASLKTPDGSAQIEGNYINKNQIAFDVNLTTNNIRLDKLLNNEQLGGISFNMQAAAKGTSLNTLDAELQSEFSQLEFKGYDFSGLSLNGKIVDGNGDINFSFKDENLNFKAKSFIELDSVDTKINLNLDVIGADLYELGLTRENIKTGLNLRAEFKGGTEDFSINSSISEAIAVYEGNQYQVGDIDLRANIDKITTEVDIKSTFLEGSLESNTSPKGLNEALKKQLQNYFLETSSQNAVTDTVKLKVKALLRPEPILTDVFFRDIERLDSISIDADFDGKNKTLYAELHMPSATYAGSSIDSLNVLIKGNATDLAFSAGISKLEYNPIKIKQTYFEGNLKNKKLLLDFISFDDQEKLAHIAAEMVLAKDTVNLKINPEELILNKKDWAIPLNNQISIAKGFLEFQNFNLSRNAQQLTINNLAEESGKERIGIDFSNFRLQGFLSLLNPDEALASGKVNGDFVIENPFGATGILADFKIDNLNVLENPLGNLTLDAKSLDINSYDFNLAIDGENVDLDLTGDYTAAKTGAKLNLDLNLDKLGMYTIQEFSNGAIKESSGYISGNFDVSGTTKNPEYEGELKFNQSRFKVSKFNSLFKISNESISLDNKGIYLKSFEIADANDNTFSMDGKINTEEIINPTFDLKLVAEQFMLLNSTKEDNELFYGIASFDADVTVKGDIQLPKVEGRLRIRKITDITYVVPESQLDVEERDGVVIFVNRENPDAILTRNDQEENVPELFEGTDLEAILEIADDAVFKIIIDEKTGDNLQVSGDAELNLNIDPNGRINLSGRYELKDGHYETSLYNLVNRRFEINPGSTVTWQGEPTNAKLDVTAIYSVETSASPLMTSVTSGQDPSVVGKFRQVLPFFVYLNVEGELLQPKLSFRLDMPEDSQGAIGGAVYGKVQQLNSQESELNKQVFSLLALNRFFPNSGSDGSSGGTAAIARNNVNKVLSGELNAFSDKIFGKSGFELDFDLDSFTDYQGETPQDRTQLNINAKKRLFNDRLIVTAGSAVDVEGSAQAGQTETPIIGNVSLEYLLTKNGIYRLRGFRKNEYQNIIDGQLFITGIALIFNKEFNRFSELFNPLKNSREKSADKKDDKKEKE